MKKLKTTKSDIFHLDKDLHGGEAELRNTCDEKNTSRYKIVKKNYVGKNHLTKLKNFRYKNFIFVSN